MTLAANSVGGSSLSGGGGYGREYITATGTSTIQLYVGAAGEPSKFGTNGFYLSASPGSNGSGAAGGAGGVGTGGDVYLEGYDWTPGTFGSDSASSGYPGGTGRCSHMGGGGAGGKDSTTNGLTGNNYGGGGGGGGGAAATPAANGANGAQGFVGVHW